MKEIHRPVAFEPIRPDAPEKFSIASYGLAGSGKSRLLATLPGKVGVVPLDRKTRHTIERAAIELGLSNGKILFPKEDYIRHQAPMQVAMMEPDKAIEYYRQHVNRIKDAVFTLVERSDIDSIGIDSGTQLWEDILFSHFGRAQRIMPRDRGAANQDIRDILNSCASKFFIITHQAKEIWRNDKPTGKYDWDGFSRIDYYCNCIVEQEFNEQRQEFYLSIRQCQDRPDLMGAAGEHCLEGAAISFAMLALQVYPDSDLSRWE
jgi:hypothetical protein